MKKFKSVVIGFKFDEDPEVINFLLGLEFLRESSIHLVHMSISLDFNSLLEINLAAYPSAEAKIIIEQAILTKLSESKSQLLSKGFVGHIDNHCIFTDNIKKGFCKYALEVNADLIILMPEKKHSLFGSFTHYQLAHANAPVMVLRPTRDEA